MVEAPPCRSEPDLAELTEYRAARKGAAFHNDAQSEAIYPTTSPAAAVDAMVSTSAPGPADVSGRARARLDQRLRRQRRRRHHDLLGGRGPVRLPVDVGRAGQHDRAGLDAGGRRSPGA